MLYYSLWDVYHVTVNCLEPIFLVISDRREATHSSQSEPATSLDPLDNTLGQPSASNLRLSAPSPYTTPSHLCPPLSARACPDCVICMFAPDVPLSEYRPSRSFAAATPPLVHTRTRLSQRRAFHNDAPFSTTNNPIVLESASSWHSYKHPLSTLKSALTTLDSALPTPHTHPRNCYDELAGATTSSAQSCRGCRLASTQR